MISRVTFYHNDYSPGGTSVKLPLEWENFALSLVRDKNLHSVVSMFKTNFVWVGSARDFIIYIEENYGEDEEIEVFFEVNTKGTWEELFSGIVSVANIEDLSKFSKFYKSTVPIGPFNTWSRFMNNRSTKVNVIGDQDIYGNSSTPAVPFILTLPSQVIQLNSSYKQNSTVLVGTLYDYTFSDPSIQEDIGQNDYVNIDFEEVLLDEVKTKNSLSISPNGSTLPNPILVISENGEYSFNIKVCFTVAYHGNTITTNQPKDSAEFRNTVEGGAGRALKIYFKINEEAAIEFDEDDFVNTPLSNPEQWTEYTYTATHTLKAGDLIRVYGRRVITASYGYANNSIFRAMNQLYFLHSSDVIIKLSGGGFVDDDDLKEFRNTNRTIESFFICEANTEFQETDTEALLVYDTFNSILSKITGVDNVLELGVFETGYRLNANMLGLHLRGYSMEERVPYWSFDDIWKVYEGPLNLGIGYTEEGKIVIKKKNDFYVSSPSVFLPNVKDLIRTNDTSKFYKTIEVEFTKRFVEVISGLDDPQTKRSWSSNLKTIGEPFVITSSGFFASVGIEQTRRTRIEASKDGKIDNDIVVIALKEEGETYRPELGSDFESVTNLLFSGTRYNIRHSCARVMNRWFNFLKGFMFGAGKELVFNGGEGNYKMTSKLYAGDFDGDAIIEEDGNFTKGSSAPSYEIKVYTCSSPMQYETFKIIEENKDNAIAIKKGEEYFPMGIVDLDYLFYKGSASMTLIQISKNAVVPDNYITQEDGNLILLEDGSGAFISE